MLVEFTQATMVVFDNELSPGHIRALEEILGVTVLDRSALILDIFAQRAKTREGRLQVELAQYKYLLPRLSGMGKSLSRQGGGIGTRGPGETKLESDRRHIRERIARLQTELEQVRQVRGVQRERRMKNSVPVVAIVGYTNAGKSTLLNRLTEAGILAEDKLFATLDPTTRKFELPCGEEILLTDTVGFIRNLPHHLIRAFRSTLDEVCYADAILVVIDASDPEFITQAEVTQSLIDELGASDKPCLFVYNKCDKGLASHPMTPTADNVYISAATGEGTDELVRRLEALATAGKKEYTFELPADKFALLNTLYSEATVLETEYTENGVKVLAICDKKTAGKLSKYIVRL